MNKSDLEVKKSERIKAIKKALQEYKKYSNLRDDYIVVVNMDEPSYRKRLHVYDLKKKKVIRDHHVSHGKNSANPYNKAMATKFSNKENSHQSSLGAMKTAETYNGKYGYSLKLDGLEKQNSNVRRRYIVIHPADYVTDRFILSNGRAGLSWGCPATDPAISKSLIDLIKEKEYQIKKDGASSKKGCFFYIHKEEE